MSFQTRWLFRYMNLAPLGSCYSLGLRVTCIKLASGEKVYHLRILHPFSNTRRLPDAISFYSSSFQNESCAQSVTKCRQTTTTLSRVRKSPRHHRQHLAQVNLLLQFIIKLLPYNFPLPILMKCRGDVAGNWDFSSSNGEIMRWQQDSISEKNRFLEQLCRVHRWAEKLPNKKIDSRLEAFKNSSLEERWRKIVDFRDKISEKKKSVGPFEPKCLGKVFAYERFNQYLVN